MGNQGEMCAVWLDEAVAADVCCVVRRGSGSRCVLCRLDEAVAADVNTQCLAHWQEFFTK